MHQEKGASAPFFLIRNLYTRFASGSPAPSVHDRSLKDARHLDKSSPAQHLPVPCPFETQPEYRSKDPHTPAPSLQEASLSDQNPHARISSQDQNPTTRAEVPSPGFLPSRFESSESAPAHDFLSPLPESDCLPPIHARYH